VAKGEYNKECNRTACSNQVAIYYNFSTQKYYCQACALIINNANRKDSHRIFGHDLCQPIFKIVTGTEQNDLII
jgi:hypothetical protein